MMLFMKRISCRLSFLKIPKACMEDPDDWTILMALSREIRIAAAIYHEPVPEHSSSELETAASAAASALAG